MILNWQHKASSRPPAQGKTVDGRDDRLGETVDTPPQIPALGAGDVAVGSIADIEAGGKAFLAGAGENHDTHVFVVFNIIDHLLEIEHGGQVPRVGRWMVNGDKGDVALLFKFDIFKFHGQLLTLKKGNHKGTKDTK
jgi:hypothetical protein